MELQRDEERRFSEGEAKRKALIISISDYNDQNLQPLEFCKNDGEKMYEILRSLGYEIVGTHKLIGNVGFNAMRNAIIEFFSDRNTKPKDTLLFYFSGHGVPDGSGDTYLSTSEIDSAYPYQNGYSFDDLTKMTSRSISRRIITILDCCYSGRAKVAKGNEKAVAKTANQAILETFENRKKIRL